MKDKRLFRFMYLLIVPGLLLLGSCDKENDYNDLNSGSLKSMDLPVPANGQMGDYIIILNEDIDLSSELIALGDFDKKNEKMFGYVNHLVNGHGVGNSQLGHVYTSIFQGFSAKLNNKQLQKVLDDPRVNKVIPDEQYALKRPPKDPVDPPAQTVPWGIGRVNGGVDGSGLTAWVVDSGIDLDHPDLNVDTKRSRSFVTTERKSTADDLHGHGTHVAGTIAALDNNIGVVGVAAGANVVSCRVLDRRGSGAFSWGIAALDYINQVGVSGDVVNMSLGPTSRYVLPEYDAWVTTVANKGIKFAIAAGNEGDDASYYSPARVNGNGIYTVSAMDSNDNFAYFSNWGDPVDCCEPGLNILSTYKGGQYATMSGTSMAAPHMAGLLLLGTPSKDGTVNGDPDGNADPIYVH